MRTNYTFIFVSDMTQSVSFYGNAFGLVLKFESPDWTEFETEGSKLALHRSHVANPDTDSTQPESTGRCRPGFLVPNLVEFHKRMLEKKVPCSQEPTEVYGAWIAHYVDPDGLVLSVGEESNSR